MNENVSLLLDLYELTMSEAYLEFKPDTQATFDLFVRELPKNRGYLIAAGLLDALSYIENLRFNHTSLEYLKAKNIFSPKFLEFLRNFRFRGSIWALPEGSICFPNEPILRVTSGIIEAQIIESFLLNTINLQTMIATKANRVVEAAAGRAVYDFALRRTQGYDAGIKVARSSYLAGFKGTSCVLAGMLYGIPIVGTMAHSYVMSFKTELASFRAYAKTFPQNTILLVDTYNTRQGIENAIIVAQELKAKGYQLKGIRLDSGDLLNLSKMARKMLNKAGLVNSLIFASGNLDEYKIDRLIKTGAKIDCFGVGTNMGVSEDAPYLDVIYKISEVSDVNGKFLPTMKLSKGKVTYPGRKQIFRVRDRKGNYIKDILGLEDEDIKAEPLLIKVVDNGRIVYKPPSLEKIREITQENLAYLPERYKVLHPKVRYPVVISPGLAKLTKELSQNLR